MTVPEYGRYYKLTAVPADWRARWPIGTVVRCTNTLGYYRGVWELSATQGWRVRLATAAEEAAARLSGAGEDSPI